jgi:hypothetical protein
MADADLSGIARPEGAGESPAGVAQVPEHLVTLRPDADSEC